jgi:hypothetical protein
MNPTRGNSSPLCHSTFGVAGRQHHRTPHPPPQAYPERFAQQALGHNSKAVHHAYSKHAEVTVPSLDDWEKEWGKNPQRSVQPKLLPVDFRSPFTDIAQSN